MEERMQKTSAFANDFPQRDRTESEWYGGVQTFIWMTEDNIVEFPFDKEHLLEVILSPKNLNEAYKAVVRNKGFSAQLRQRMVLMAMMILALY